MALHRRDTVLAPISDNHWCWCLVLLNCVGAVEAPLIDAKADASGGMSDAGMQAAGERDSGVSDQQPVGSGAIDAGAVVLPDAGLQTGSDAGPDGRVPIFVASGDGAWRASSCDLGRTWLLREESPIRADHSAWTNVGGLAVHDGVFVLATGWGEPGRILRSTDAVSWTVLPDVNFVRPGQAPGLQSSVAAVVHDGLRFVAFTNGILHSPDGLKWSKTNFSVPPGAHQVRQVRAVPATHAIIASVETQYGTEHALGNWIIVSENGGQDWREGMGFDKSCSFPIQLDGDIAVRQNTIVVASQNICRSTDLGRTWSRATTTGVPRDVRSVFTDDNAFYALAGRSVFRSSDGANWSVLSTFPVDVGRGIFGAQTYAVTSTDGRRFFWSADALNWSEGQAPTALSPAKVRDMAFSFGTPATQCPK